MFYSLRDSEITITDKKDVSIVQEKNSMSQEAFPTQQNAIDWGKQYIQIYCDGFIDFEDIKYTDDNDVILTELKIDNNVEITLTEKTGVLKGKYKIELLNETTGDSVKLTFVFTDGVASAIINPDAPGNYILLANEFLFNEKRLITYDKIEKFMFTVVD
jgi:hypothetical protein